MGQTSTSPGPHLHPTYQPDTEDILKTITDNADNNLQCHRRGKLGRMHKPSTPTTSLIHGDEVIGKFYQKTWSLSLSLSPLTLGMVWSNATGIPHHHPPSPPKNPGPLHTPTTNITPSLRKLWHRHQLLERAALPWRLHWERSEEGSGWSG